MMYNGYLPTTHEGLIDTIDEAAPFSTPAMVFSEKRRRLQGYVQHSPSSIAPKCTVRRQDTIPPTKAIQNTIKLQLDYQH